MGRGRAVGGHGVVAPGGQAVGAGGRAARTTHTAAKASTAPARPSAAAAPAPAAAADALAPGGQAVPAPVRQHLPLLRQRRRRVRRVRCADQRLGQCALIHLFREGVCSSWQCGRQGRCRCTHQPLPKSSGPNDSPGHWHSPHTSPPAACSRGCGSTAPGAAAAALQRAEGKRVRAGRQAGDGRISGRPTGARGTARPTPPCAAQPSGGASVDRRRAARPAAAHPSCAAPPAAPPPRPPAQRCAVPAWGGKRGWTGSAG